MVLTEFPTPHPAERPHLPDNLEFVVELRHLSPLYQRLASRPDLLMLLEQQTGLRRVNNSDLSVVTQDTAMHISELLYAHGEHHTPAWLANMVDMSAGNGMMYFLRSCSTLREMLAELQRIQPLWLPHGTFQLQETESGFRIRIDPLIPATRLGHHLRWEGLMSWLRRALGYCLGQDLTPDRTHLMSPASPNPAALHLLLGNNLHFNADHMAFEFDHVRLDAPLPGGNAAIKQAMRIGLYLMAKEQHRRNSHRLHVLGWLQTHPDLGQATLAQAADFAGIPSSTLRRHLQKDNTRFSQLLAAYRREQAFEQLVLNHTPIESCALTLGYANRVALERAFKGWYGVTPAQAQREHMALTLADSHLDWRAPDKITRFVPPQASLRDLLQQQVDIDALVVRLAADPFLQAYVVGLANQAWFGGQCTHSPREAITNVIGTSTLRNLAFAIDVPRITLHSTPQHVTLWQRATLASAMVESLACRQGHAPDKAGQMGLIANWYELGAVLLLQLHGGRYQSWLSQTRTMCRSAILEGERAMFGLDRHAAGGLLLSAWQLPVDAIQGVREGSAPSSEEGRLISAVVQWLQYGQHPHLPEQKHALDEAMKRARLCPNDFLPWLPSPHATMASNKVNTLV
jgi:AraC-like DNA-binding protein/HD-like signal output (HDOD) protein